MWTTCNRCGAEVLASYMYNHVLWHERDETLPCEYCGYVPCACDDINMEYERYNEEEELFG